MRHLDLFSGIGGFALAARWMNWETVQFVEIDKFCQKVLKKHWHNVPIHGDIKTFDGTRFRGTVDIVTGGFPCQTFSTAGKGEADISLWKEMFRVIGEVRPRLVVAENVYGLLTTKKGMAFECVCADLESEGYQVQAFVIPACAVNAPHRRDRVWIVAHANEIHQPVESDCRTTPDTDSVQRCEGRMHETEPKETERHPGTFDPRNGWTDWQNFPTQPPLRLGNDGLSPGLARSSIQAVGNAVVPALVFEIFRAIQYIDYEGNYR